MNTGAGGSLSPVHLALELAVDRWSNTSQPVSASLRGEVVAIEAFQMLNLPHVCFAVEAWWAMEVQAA